MNGLRRLLRPSLPMLAGIVATASVLLAICLSGEISLPAVTYFAYFYSTYALVVLCVRIPGAIRRVRTRLSAKFARLTARETRLGRLLRGLSDPERRTRVLLVPALVFNLVYAAFKLASGIWLRSPWLIGVGTYYGILAGMRYALLRTLLGRTGGAANEERDWKTYRWTAIQLLLLTLVMSGLIAQTVYFGRAYHYPGTLIYAFALYAFIKIIVAVSLLLRRRGDDNRLLAASRCISFACALMSMLALQTALISEFGGGDMAFARTANTLSGVAVCALMLVICNIMLRKVARHNRQSRGELVN